MKRNFSAILKTLDGEDFKDDKEQPLTLKKVCLMVLGLTLPDDDKMDGQKKFDLFKLANRINEGGVVEVSAEEVATLKARIAKAYGPFIVGAAFTLLEQEAEAPATA